MVELPWNNKSKIIKDLNSAQKILDEDHYGLEKEERIIEYLAVQKRSKSRVYFMLVGPPGVGKTSWVSLSQELREGSLLEFL